MSARKKTWVKCAFSELNLTPTTAGSDTATPAKRTRSAPSAATKLKRNQNGNTTPTLSATSVDLTVDDDDEDGCGGESEPPPTLSANWLDNFAPKSSEELAVHAKKIGELRDWLRHCEAERSKVRAQICLLTGPTGAGKTATLRVLAKELGYQLQEWINQVDCEAVTALGDQPSDGCYVGSRLQAFKSFLLHASRYKSLLNAQNKRLLLVEDIPNVLLSDAEANFDELLEEYCNHGISPLVFIVTDAKSRGLNISYKLFPDQLKAKHRIEHISFNSIAATIMQKSMKAFCGIMQQKENKALYKVPSSAVVDSIVVGAQGDIRNALINLHLSALKGVPNMPTKKLDISVTSKGRKGKRKTQSTLKSIGRDESITLMHALGRVLNPKCNEDKRLQHSPEILTEAFCTEPRNFVNFIHANYLPHFRDIEDVVFAINDLGLADAMLNDYRDDGLSLMGLNLAIRGSMLANSAPVSGWMPVRGPKRINLQPQATLAEQKLLGTGYAGISKALYASEYKSLVKCIAAKTTEEMAKENELSIED